MGHVPPVPPYSYSASAFALSMLFYARQQNALRVLYPVYTMKQTSSKHQADIMQKWG